MSNQSHFKGVWLLVLLMSLIIGGQFFSLLQAPNSQFIGNSIDGFRSYMAAMYHLEHDTTYSHYGGMNYPYGDRVDFTDNIPLLTNSVKFISQNIVDIRPWFTGIWNCFLLLSLLLSGVFLFLIFRILQLPLWYAIPVAIGISFLSPQLVRIHSHYGLAHPFVVPMIIYFLLRFEEYKSWKWSVGVGIVILLIYYLHFYLFAISLFILGFYWLIKIGRNFSWGNLKLTLGHTSLQIFIPFILLFLSLYLGDTVLDRPTKPFGFLLYKARLESIFFPIEFQPGRILKKIYQDELWWIEREGIAYIGGVAVFFFFWTFYRRFRTYKTAALFPEAATEHRSFMINLFGAGLLLLLFALGFPFILPGGSKLLDYLGPLQQFRSIGRFAWGFYYIINILAFYHLYHIIIKIETKNWRIGLFILVIGWINFEGITHLNKKRIKKKYPHPAMRYNFMDNHNRWLKKVDWQKYQAILPVPYFHLGSENFWVNAQGPAAYRSLWASVRTGLPLISSFMGRTSLSQTKNFLSFVGEPLEPQKLIDDLPNDKPILIFIVKANYQNQEAKYQHLIEGETPLYEDRSVLLYELPLNRMKNRIENKRERIATVLKDAVLFNHNSWMTEDSLAQFIHQDFDHLENKSAFAGAGLFSGKANIHHIIFEGPIPNQTPDSLYNLSFWISLHADLHARTWIKLEEFNRSTGAISKERAFHIDHLVGAMVEDWALVEDTLRFNEPQNGLRITIGNDNIGEQLLLLDELQIRRADQDLFKQEEKSLWQNNRRYEGNGK